MFNSQQSYDLGDQQIPFFMSPQVDNVVHQNLFSPESNLFPAAGGGKKKQKNPSENLESTEKGGKNNEKNKKKINHCEIERQRRQEMANLYASLRNLLPLEYIKGKRSASDHMHEAVNYINHLQKNISQLRLKNKTFTKSPNLSTGSSGKTSGESCSGRRKSTIKLNLCENGVEILISFSPKDEVFPMSKVLNKLVVQGFNVLSYLSSRSDDGSTLYMIQSEVDDPSCIDIIGLQKSLTDMIIQDPTTC